MPLPFPRGTPPTFQAHVLHRATTGADVRPFAIAPLFLVLLSTLCFAAEGILVPDAAGVGPREHSSWSPARATSVKMVSSYMEELATVPLSALRRDLTVYRHQPSGLRVALVDIPGPLCQADIVVATKCDNNKGLPHCLEHLVFMGSAEYPNRGFLDKLANLCISQGTNAWTDRDHTA